MNLLLLYLAPSAVVFLAGVVRASRRCEQPAMAVAPIRGARRIRR